MTNVEIVTGTSPFYYKRIKCRKCKGYMYPVRENYSSYYICDECGNRLSPSGNSDYVNILKIIDNESSIEHLEDMISKLYVEIRDLKNKLEEQ